MNPQRIEISYKTIIFTFLFLVGAALLWNLRDIILLFFICVIFMLALNPTVSYIEKFRIPRPLAILILYLVIISVFSFVIASVIPVMVDQTQALVSALPAMLQNVKIFGFSAIDLSSQFKIIENLPTEIARFILSIFSNIFTIIAVLMVTFYMLLERPRFTKHTFTFFGSKNNDKILKIIETLERKLGHWVNAELLLMVIIGVLSYIGYLIVGLSYSVPLAILAGLFEIVPNFGPFLTTTIASIVAFTTSPISTIFVVLWGIVVHQSENAFITPKIMKETVGLNPILTVFLLAVGAKLAGIPGAILAIPVYLTIETIVAVLIEKK